MSPYLPNDGVLYFGSGTDPCQADTDQDGLMDKFEVDNQTTFAGLDPFNADSDDDGTFDAFEDPDGDGLNNLQEWSYSSNPSLFDTDGDGASDGQEAAQGSDPTDPTDGGNPPDPDDVVKFELKVGPNGGHGAWALIVGGQGIIAPFYRTTSEVRTFEKGKSYAVRVYHLGTSPNYWLRTCRDSYAYEAWITLDSPADACFVLEDPDAFVNCAHPEPWPPINPVKGKTATLHVLNFDLQIDSNNDGTIDDADDPIEEAAPGKLICLNDDDDNGDGSPDKDDTGATVGETDLVRLELAADPPPAGYKWKLTFPNTKVKLWWNDDRSNGVKPAIVSGQLSAGALPAAVCYVEGLAVSATSGDISIVLAYTKPDDTEVCSDTVTATVMRLSFLGTVAAMDNQAIPVTESLQVSNFVTTDVLPAASAFADGNADSDNFRLEVEDASIAGASVQVKLEIVRGGNVQPNPVTYTLDKKVGTKFRGEYLRLVSDAVDDAEPGAGDAGNQSIPVRLEDTIRITYNPAGDSKCIREFDVGRPSSESNNGANKRLHDARTINFAFKGFVGALPQEPFDDGNANGLRDGGEAFLNIAGGTASFDANMNAAQMAAYVSTMMSNFNDRLAQACVKGSSTSNFAVAVPNGVNLSNGIEWLNIIENPGGPVDFSTELLALLPGTGVRSAANTDGNSTNDVLDVLFVYNLRIGVPPNGIAGAISLGDAQSGGLVASPVGVFHGTILFGSELFGAFVSHYSLAHESCHMVFDQPDSAGNMPTATQRPGAATERDMTFPELHGNPGGNAVSNSGKRMSFQIIGHAGQVQTYRGNTTFVRD